MNRFFRTAFSATLVCLYLTLFTVLFTGIRMPFPAFSCLYFGLLIALLPAAVRKLSGREPLFYLLGAVTALSGFIPLVLWHCPASHMVIHLLGIAAAAVFLPLLRHRTTHGRFLAKYQFAAVSLLILLGLICLAMLTGIYTDGEAAVRTEVLKLAVNNTVPYAIVLLVTGVLLLRGLRAAAGTVDEQAFNRRQLRDTLIFAVLVSLVFAVDPFIYLQKAVLFLFNDVLRPGARFLVSCLAALLRLLSARKSGEDPQPLPTEEEATDPKPIPTLESGEAEPEHYYVEDTELARTIAYIFVAAAAAILLWILVRQIRKLIRNLRERALKRGSGYPNEIREALPEEEGTGRKDRPKKRSADPRERMRYLYGDFLRHLKKLKVSFGRTDTCKEIRDRAEDSAAADPPVLSEFTELYEQARYREEEMPSEADARRMKELLDRIKKKA